MELSRNSGTNNIMMQGPLSTPYAGENNIIPVEHQDGGAGAGSSTKPAVCQSSAVTKSITFISGAASHAAASVSAHMSKASSSSTSPKLNSLSTSTPANLFTARPGHHAVLAAAASAAVPVELCLSKNNSSANIRLNNSNHSDSPAANVAIAANISSGYENPYDIAHLASGSTTPSIRRNSDKFSGNADVRYKECLKNHAANMGGYALDGCGEFMPCGEKDSIEALKCAACGCHRNFHRREVNGESSAAAAASHSMGLLALPSTGMNPSSTSTSNSDYGEGDQHTHTNCGMAGSDSGGPFLGGHYSAANIGATLTHPHHHHHHHHHQYMHAWMQGSRLMASAGGAGAGHHAGGLAGHYGPGGQYPYMGGTPAHVTGGLISGQQGGGGGVARLVGAGHMMSTAGTMTPGKRFRTKFTREQREKMFDFSEKVGWRIHKQDEAAVQQFCAEAGVKRHVLKVWMHNNKNTFGKKLLRFPEAFNAVPKSSA